MGYSPQPVNAVDSTLGTPQLRVITDPYSNCIEPVNHSVDVACIDAFSHQIKNPSTLVIVNASTHTSHEFNDNLKVWKESGLTIYRISPYSPELNVFENIWRKIK